MPKITVRAPGTPPAPKPEPPRELPPAPRKGILSRIAEIILSDIRAKLGLDERSLSEKARYEEFLEMTGMKK